MRRVLPTAVLFLCSLGCDQIYYAPPTQRVPQKHPVTMLLDMAPGRPAETWAAVVAGVQDSNDYHADWRWAGDQSTFTFATGMFPSLGYGGWALTAHVTAASVTLDKTGPQRLVFVINGKTVGAAGLDVSRRYDLSFPVGPDLLRSSPVVVQMLASPCVPAKYGPPYCVLLHSIGFVQEPH